MDATHASLIDTEDVNKSPTKDIPASDHNNQTKDEDKTTTTITPTEPPKKVISLKHIKEHNTVSTPLPAPKKRVFLPETDSKQGENIKYLIIYYFLMQR